MDYAKVRSELEQRLRPEHLREFLRLLSTKCTRYDRVQRELRKRMCATDVEELMTWIHSRASRLDAEAAESLSTVSNRVLEYLGDGVAEGSSRIDYVAVQVELSKQLNPAHVFELLMWVHSKPHKDGSASAGVSVHSSFSSSKVNGTEDDADYIVDDPWNINYGVVRAELAKEHSEAHVREFLRLISIKGELKKRLFLQAVVGDPMRNWLWGSGDLASLLKVLPKGTMDRPRVSYTEASGCDIPQSFVDNKVRIAEWSFRTIAQRDLTYLRTQAGNVQDFTAQVKTIPELKLIES